MAGRDAGFRRHTSKRDLGGAVLGEETTGRVQQRIARARPLFGRGTAGLAAGGETF
jgi:hypothetical protein